MKNYRFLINDIECVITLGRNQSLQNIHIKTHQKHI